MRSPAIDRLRSRAEQLVKLGESDELIWGELLSIAIHKFGRTVPEETIRRIVTEARRNGRGAAEDRVTLLRSLAEILADPAASEPPAPVAPRLAWAGRITLLAAREKAGKSTLATAAAAAVSAGRPFLGDASSRGTVVWVGLEEHVFDLAGRLMEFGADPAQVYVSERLLNPLADLTAAVEKVRHDARARHHARPRERVHPPPAG